MKNDIRELVDILSNLEAVGDQEDIQQKLTRLQREWSYAESTFKVAFHNAVLWSADEPPSSGSIFKDLREAFEIMETSCGQWKRFIADDFEH